MFRFNMPLLLLLILAIPTLAVEDGRKSHIERAMTTALDAVDSADGLDAHEAKELASAYFSSVISGCGGIGEVRDLNGVWTADSRIGLGAEKGPDVTIARDGAFVRAEGYESVTFTGGKAVVLEATGVRGVDRLGLKAEEATHIETAMTTALAQVDLTDGLDAHEARELAFVYFLSAISGCGGIGEVRDAEGSWIAHSRIGRGAAPGPDVTIARDGAYIRAEGYPSVVLTSGKAVVLDANLPQP